MEILKFPVGQLQTNCYILFNPETLECVIIDPADAGNFITAKILELNLFPKAILLTHGHFDHVLAVAELKFSFNIPFLMHRKDTFLLKRTSETSKYFTGVSADPQPNPDNYFSDKKILKYAGLNLKVIETPGHTPGSVCFYKKPYLFSGDTIFKDGIGRTDFSYASEEKLKESIKKLKKLPSGTIVYPGHGKETIIGKV